MLPNFHSRTKKCLRIKYEFRSRSSIAQFYSWSNIYRENQVLSKIPIWLDISLPDCNQIYAKIGILVCGPTTQFFKSNFVRLDQFWKPDLRCNNHLEENEKRKIAKATAFPIANCYNLPF